MSEAFGFIKRSRSKILAMVSDAADIAGENITMLLAYSPVLDAYGFNGAVWVSGEPESKAPFQSAQKLRRHLHLS